MQSQYITEPAVVDLPPELWLLIMRQLEIFGAKRPLSRFCQASRSCYELELPILWEKIVIFKSDITWAKGDMAWNQLPRVLATAADKLKLVRELTLSDYVTVDTTGLESAPPFISTSLPAVDLERARLSLSLLCLRLLARLTTVGRETRHEAAWQTFSSPSCPRLARFQEAPATKLYNPNRPKSIAFDNNK